MNPENVPVTRFTPQEKLLAAEEFQNQLARVGLVPDTRKLLVRRTAGFLQILVGLVVAMFVALLAILLAFFVFNKLLHMGT